MKELAQNPVRNAPLARADVVGLSDDTSDKASGMPEKRPGYPPFDNADRID